MKRVTSHVSSKSQASERISVKVGDLQIQMDPSEIQVVQVDVDDKTVTIQTGTAAAAPTPASPEDEPVESPLSRAFCASLSDDASSDSDSEDPIPDETIDEGVRRVNAARFADSTPGCPENYSDWPGHPGGYPSSGANCFDSEDSLPLLDRLCNFWHKYSDDFTWLMKTIAIVMAIVCTTSGLMDIAHIYQNKVAQAELEQKLQAGYYPGTGSAGLALVGSDYAYNAYSGRWERVKDPSEDDTALYWLTIKYVDFQGNRLAPDYRGAFAVGEEFSIVSPTIQCYEAIDAIVEGVMYEGDTEVTVRYQDTRPKNPDYQDTAITAAAWLANGATSSNMMRNSDGQSLPSNGPVVD